MASTRWQELAERLAGEIRSGAREPGSRLPSLAQLQADGWSDSTAGRAYQDLREQGMVTVVANRGFYVADPLPVGDGARSLTDRVVALEAAHEAVLQRIGDLDAAMLEIYTRTGQPRPDLAGGRRDPRHGTATG